jgi:hypothetical protein
MDETLRTIAEVNAGDVPTDDFDRCDAPAPVLRRYTALLERFAREEVVYCYWRSTRRAMAALAGETDLDLLVARESQHAASRALLDSGFKMFSSVPQRDHPSIVSFLIHDEDSGEIVHVHLHTRLVVGGALLKNYRLPWEAALLRRAAARNGLNLALLDPASEAVLLLVRSCLELRRTDPVVLRNWGQATRKFELDRAALAASVDRAELRARAAEFLGEDIGHALADALFDTKPLHEQRAVRRRVRGALEDYRTYNRLEAAFRAGSRAVLWASGALNQRVLHWPRPWSRRAPGGGIVVAVIGVDGSGKTTLVRGLRTWLAREADVMPLYFGTGDGRPSLLLLPFKLLVPAVSLLFRSKPKGSSHSEVTNAPPGFAYSVSLAVWATILAVEKRMKLRAARRAADRGMVVITDRFPQDEILDFNDGPLLPRLRRIPRWLRDFEASAYALARRRPPDLVIRLVASPELIASREPRMDPRTIRDRTAAVQRLTFAGASIASIPAAQPAADVLSAAKAEIWRLL